MDNPVLELWGKQWLRLDFSHAHPEQADVFTAHMRLPEHLQLVVQQFSGHHGVYLEPKSLDGRRPSSDFQVVWMPKMDHAELMLLRQTVANVVGIARMGHKMGLRCKTIHAADVFAVLRPGHTFLPPGKRQTYLVGPFVYGNSAVLRCPGLECTWMGCKASAGSGCQVSCSRADVPSSIGSRTPTQDDQDGTW